MTSKRAGLLSLVAVLALALAGPTTAAATNVWKDSGAPLEEHVKASLHGSQLFASEKGGMICEVDAVLTAEPGSTGRVTNFQSKKCVGLFGELASCTVESSQQFGPFWHVDVETGFLQVNVPVLRYFDKGCPVERMATSIPNMATVPLEPKSIYEVEYAGSGEASFDGGPSGEYEEFGVWLVTPAGTYGIG